MSTRPRQTVHSRRYLSVYTYCYLVSILLPGIPIFNLRKTWEKLLLAARVIAAIENPSDVCVLSNRQYGQVLKSIAKNTAIVLSVKYLYAILHTACHPEVCTLHWWQPHRGQVHTGNIHQPNPKGVS